MISNRAPGAAPAGRVRRSDVALAAGVTLLQLAAPRTGPDEDLSTAEGAAGLVLTLAMGVPLAWRRVRPELVAAVAAVAYLLQAAVVDLVPPYAPWVALFALLVHTPAGRRAVVGSALAGAGLFAGFALGAASHEAGWGAVPLLATLTVVVLLGGGLVRTRRARAEAARRANGLALQAAQTEERLHIARDLHDLVGHGLSLITIQVGAARMALQGGDAEGARVAMLKVDAASRGAMQEMRQLLDVLRSGEPAPAGTPGAAGREPAPRLEDIDATVAASRAAGQMVDLRTAVDPARVPPAVQMSVYRIVQEALTNAARHAPGRPVEVLLEAVPAEAGPALRLTVVNPMTGLHQPPGEHPGHGLEGMRERVSALGGSVTAGPDDRGRWCVHAVIPLPEEDVP